MREDKVKINNKDIQFLQVKSPYGAFNATRSKLTCEAYAVRIGSMAKVNGFRDAIQPSH